MLIYSSDAQCGMGVGRGGGGGGGVGGVVVWELKSILN